MADGSKSSNEFGAIDFLWRLVASFFLVFLTFNPSGWSYFHWVKRAVANEDGTGGISAVHFFVGAILLAGWTVFLVSTKNSLGLLGSVIGALIIGTGIWLLIDIGVVSAGSANAVAWLVLSAMAILLAIGLSWSHVWRRLSGQLEVDDND
ncbi:hypothetical protein F3N42_03125 [Marinihelvus fidelis]|uniref:Uncharacterized protein n=1 Tax=Marinihelvus fidelis TaxID=2613842 RepID=A0A5N0TE95_9GAMM|nr:DUF6524 family protein [Marinihelvus fidelis]KAA9133355.1 hypothetical protein F3N42_03125 [Marinihelvus fidelis]